MTGETQNIIISNLDKFKKIENRLISAGPNKLYVLSDFDKTLTKAFVDGKNRPSMVSILRDNNYLSKDYPKKAKLLYRKYHPIEIDPKIPIEKKKKEMEKWWKSHFNLLIGSGLSKKDLESIIESNNIKLKDGAVDFFNLLSNLKVPLIVISANGLGGDLIKMFFERHKIMFKNVHIISNSYEWDKKGKAIRAKEPIIHSFNKNEIDIKKFPIFKEIKERKNIILLGDNEGDAKMAKKFNYENIIKIGFLNKEIENNLENYKKVYDLLILNNGFEDGSFEIVNEIINKISQK